MLALACAGALAGVIASTASSSAAAARVTAHTAQSNVVAAAKAAVQKGYGTGFVESPPATGPKGVKGKTVWWISCGSLYPSCVAAANQFKAAATKYLGWHVTVVDGKSVPATVEAEIRQAIAAHAAAIGVDSMDCSDIKGAVQAAKAAHVIVVPRAGFDCNASELGANKGQSLYTAEPKIFGDADPTGLFGGWAKMLAQYIIAKNNGHLSLFYVSCDDKLVCTAINNGFMGEMKKCTGCKVVNVPYSFADVPNPATQEWKSALLAHPTVSQLQFIPEGLLALGLGTAIKQAGRKFTIYGGAGSPQDFSLIGSGGEVDSVVRQDEQSTWATADTINRLLAGEKASQLPNEGGGFQVVDKNHNLPPAGQAPKPATNFQAVYEKVWTGK
jgi:ribose transport system substrate-binding protein